MKRLFWALFKGFSKVKITSKIDLTSANKNNFQGCFFALKDSFRPQNPRTTPTKSTINIASGKLGVVRILPFSLVPTIRTPPPRKLTV